jgi:hypothetical protein
MKKFIIALLLVPSLALANPPITWGGSTTAQMFPTIVKTLLGNGFALYPAKALVGDCSDGNATISSGTTTLTRDMYYNNLTLNGTGVISVQNQRIFVCGTLDITAAAAGAFFANGGAGGTGGATGTAGSAGANTAVGTNLTGRAGGAGGAGGTAAGTEGAAATSGNAISCVTGTNGSGASGAAGGTGASGAGGVIRGQSACTAWPMRDIAMWFTPQTGAGAQIFTAGSGAGGSGGGGDTTNSGAGGGGGGASGATIYVAAGTIATSVSTPAGVFSAKGGAGGNGGTPTVGNTGGGGGGGGGSGGWAVIKWNARTGVTVTNAIQTTAGTSGTGGTGHGTGTNGNNGGATASQPGLIQTLDFSTGTITTSLTGNANL